MKRVLSLFFFLCVSLTLVAGVNPNQRSYNFFYFSKRTAPIEIQGDSLTPLSYKSNPDYGILPYESPCENCLELLDYRDATSRFYIDNKTAGNHFYKQQSYGPFNYRDSSGWWREINYRLKPASGDIFIASDQPSPVVINLDEKFSSITCENKKILFNKNLELYHVDRNGNMESFGNPDWTHYSAGDEGVLVQNFYPGIDLQLIVFEGKLKTNFIFNIPPPYTDGYVVMKEKIELPTGLAFNFSETTDWGNNKFYGILGITDHKKEFFRIHPGVAFDSQGQPSIIQLGSEMNKENELTTFLPMDWLNNPATSYPVVLDPLVSATGSLPQASITGSQYSPVCWTNGCLYNLSFLSPANCVITDIRFTFHYFAFAPCTWQDGGISINYGTCRSPASSAHTCGIALGGDCGLNNVTMINDFSTCLPPPQCTPYNMDFTMNFYRCNHDSTPGCNAACIAANAPWTMTVVGETVHLQAGSLSPTQQICEGDSVLISATAQDGIPPYSYLWTPSGATTNSLYVSPTSTTEYYITIMDSCGTTLNDSTRVIVLPNTNPGFTISPTPGCVGQPITFTGLGSGASTDYNWQFPNSNSSVVSNNQAPTVQYLSPGTYPATLLYTSGTCVFPLSQNVTVDSNLVPAVSVTSSVASPVCSGTAVVFTAAPVNGGATPTYQWQVNGVNAGTNSDTFSVVLTTNSTILVTMTSSAPCVSSASSNSQIVMTTTANVTPSVDITSNPLPPFCAGTLVTFTASPVFGGSSPTYQWQLNGLNTGTNSDTFSISSLANGDVIGVQLSSSANCVTPPTATDTFQVTTTPVLIPSVTISVTPNDTVCSGTNVQFTATPTNGGTTPGYQWTLNGVSIPGAVLNSYSSSTLSNGDVIGISMSSSDACAAGLIGTDSVSITLLPNITPAVTISVNPNDTVCAGSTVVFTATPVNGGSAPAYQWQVNGTNAGTSSNTFTSSALSNSSIVSVSLTSNAACLTSSTATNQVLMTMVSAVNPAVSISASPALPVCPGTSVTFTATASFGGTSPVFQWQLNGAPVGTNSNTYSSSTLSNNDTITVVMTSNSSCTTTSTVSSGPFVIAINPLVSPSVSITSVPDTICIGAPITFNTSVVNGGVNPSYQWFVNGVSNSNTNSTFTSTSLIQGSTVYVIITSSASCLSQSTASSNTISVITYSPLQVVTSGVLTTCPKEPVVMTAIASGGSGQPYTYSWSNGAGNGSLVTVTPVTTTNYVVSVNDACSLIPVTGSVLVNVLTAPVALYSYSPDDPSSYYPKISFMDLSGGAVSWSWNFGDGDSSNLQNPVHLFPEAGTYNVSLAVTNSIGCTDTVTFRIFIKEDIAFYIPNSFSPNGDGKNEFFEPMGTSLTDFEFIIYDRWGNEIFKGGPLNPWDGTIEGKKPAPEGVYIYRIDLKNPKFDKQVITGGVTLIR